MRASNHNARVDSSGRHNDRNFDVTKAPHIDKDLVERNQYWVYDGDTSRSFREAELEYYKDTFGEYRSNQNNRYRDMNKKKLVKTMKQYHDAKNTRPEDKILEIGSVDDHPEPEVLWECALEYQKRFNEKYGDHCKILDMSLHLDEPGAAPHVHVRRVWMGHNSHGELCVSQGKALNEMGILPPDAESPVNKYNNAKITFTYEDNEIFRQICRSKGIEIEEPDPSRRRSLPLKEFKAKKLDEEIERQRKTVNHLEQKIDARKKELEDLPKDSDIREAVGAMEDLLLNPMFNGQYDETVRRARKERLYKRFEILVTEYYKNEIPKLTDPARMAERLRAAEEVIRDNGLEDQYRERQKKTKDKKERDFLI